MLGSLTWRIERLRDAAGAHYSTATDLADYLVKKGLPFRDAHEVVGKTVRYAMAHGKELGELTLDELQPFSPLIGDDVHGAITLEASLRARDVTGGTAPDAVRRQLAWPGGSSGDLAPDRRRPLAARAGARRAGPRRVREKGPPVAPELRLPVPASALKAHIDEEAVVVGWTIPRHARGRLGAARPRDRVRLYRREEDDGAPAKPAMLSGGRIVGYDEIASVRLDSPAPAVVRGNTMEWVDRTRAAAGRRYVYVVTATDSRGTHQPAVGATRRPLPRRAQGPAHRAGSAGDRQVTLDWEPPAELLDGSPASGPLLYVVLRGVGSEGALESHSAGCLGHLLRGRGPRQRRRVPLRGAGGAHGPPGGRRRIPLESRDGIPVDTDAAPSAHQPGRRPLARRTPPRVDGEPRGRRGAVRRVPGPGAGAPIRVGTALAGTTTFIDRDVRAGTVYRYAVTAIDRARTPNESARSNEVTATAP